MTGRISRAEVVATGTTTPRTLGDITADAVNVKGFGALNGANNLAPLQRSMGLDREVKIDIPTGITQSLKAAGTYFKISPVLTWDDLTSSGLFDQTVSGFATDSGGYINRESGRIFVGQAASKFAGDSLAYDSGNSFLSDKTITPAYLPINGQVVSFAEKGHYAYVAGAQTLDSGAAIGFGSAIINNEPSGGGAWGFIAEVQHEQQNGHSSYGMELAVKNKSTIDTLKTPYNTQGGCFGLWCAGGSDDAFGAPTRPSTAAIVVLGNDSTWNTGLVFANDALTGADGITGRGTAIALAKGHVVQWFQPEDDTLGFQIVSEVSTRNGATQVVVSNNEFALKSRVGNNLFRVNNSLGDTNGIYISSKPTNGSPSIQASGNDTDIDLELKGKGAGLLKVGTHQSISSETLTGYIEIKDELGTIRKVAIIS